MIVYRVIENKFKFGVNNKIRNEYIDYQNNIISTPSRGYINAYNTHSYEANIQYVHFFHFYEDAIQYISERLENSASDYYIAFYEIPNELLKEHMGFGIYPFHIYKNIPVLEYSIPFIKLESRFIMGQLASYSYEISESEEYENYISGGYNNYLNSSNENIKELILRKIKDE